MIMLESALSLEPRSNPEIMGVLVAASESAYVSKTRLGELHLVEALLRIGSVSESLVATGVDVESARAGVKAMIARLPRRPWFGAQLLHAIENRHAVLDPFHEVRAAARAAGLKELTGPYALACFVGAPSRRDLLDVLGASRFSLLRYRWYVAHRAAADAAFPSEGPVRVVLHDDPFTPMDFVITALTDVFGCARDAAEALTRRVHEQGSATLATMGAEVAARRIAEVRSRANELGWPLRLEATNAAM